MKRLLLAICCLMVMAGPASAVLVTINDLTLDALVLFGSGLLGLVGIGRRGRKKS